MDIQLREASRTFAAEPTLENYKIYARLAERANQPIPCYFCRSECCTCEDCALIFCDCGAGFCQDCGLNYVCGDSDCHVGFLCPDCTDKCRFCKRGVCPGHNTSCVECEEQHNERPGSVSSGQVCLECSGYCEICSEQFCADHMDLENSICSRCEESGN